MGDKGSDRSPPLEQRSSKKRKEDVPSQTLLRSPQRGMSNRSRSSSRHSLQNGTIGLSQDDQTWKKVAITAWNEEMQNVTGHMSRNNAKEIFMKVLDSIGSELDTN